MRLEAGVALTTLLLVVSCKAKEATVPEGASKTWPEMSTGDRIEHMSSVVSPRMKALFQDFDKARFSDFGCPTCHGEGAEDGGFAMPNPSLPTLDASGLFKQHRKEAPEITRFMWKEVEPEMAALLGLPKGEEGLHCASCHPMAGE
jgi:hypothetical protein